ncbi:MAG: hypothetical protein J7577_17065 [Sphingobacteriaceae bacterium]|nr:hypothetical protein [Sphingobacteriaceae bacterium]
MKKFLTILFAIFIVNLGCKKENIGGGTLCACTYANDAVLGLVIKTSSGLDLLNAKTTGYFDKTKIQLYSKDANNVITPIRFDIAPPFTYLYTLKMEYYYLSSHEIVLKSKSVKNIFYLKLGDKEYELNLKINNNAVEKLLIDNIDAPRELPNKEQYLNSIYTLKI